jgi:hypothetical protein
MVSPRDGEQQSSLALIQLPDRLREGTQLLAVFLPWLPCGRVVGNDYYPYVMAMHGGGRFAVPDTRTGRRLLPLNH